jgi:hypothetical protein
VNRVEFSKSATKLLSHMYLRGENALIDYVKRSDDEQMRMFVLKKSKCDGVRNKSWHQFGKAMDIYFLNEALTEVAPPKLGFEYWHKYWEKRCGGKPMIDWDRGHFE